MCYFIDIHVPNMQLLDFLDIIISVLFMNVESFL